MSVMCISYRMQNLNEIEAERIILDETKVRSVLEDLLSSTEIFEAVVLSTCLRTEVYADLDRFHVGIENIYRVLSKHTQIDEEMLARTGTVFLDDQAVLHLFKVTSGLDSIVVGEGEILGQAKYAYVMAQGLKCVGPQLNLLFKQAFEVGKQVRQDTQLSSGITSMAHASVAIASSHVGEDFSSKVVAVLGAGQMGKTVVKALMQRYQIKDITLINRTLDKAKMLADEFSVKFEEFENLGKVISNSDVLFVATSAPEVILGEVVMTKAMETKVTPMVVSDLSVPRNVATEVAYVKGVTLFDINDVTRFVEKTKEAKQFAVHQAQEIINEKLLEHREALKFKGVDSLVSDIVEQFNDIKSEFMKKRLKDKTTFSKDEVEVLLNQLTASVVHLPVSRIKENLRESKDQRFFEAVRYLFNLEEY